MSNYSNNNHKSGIPWWAVVCCFVFGLWPIGIVLLVMKLGQEGGAFSSRQGRESCERFTREVHRGAAEARRAAEDAAQAARNAAQRAREASQEKARQEEAARAADRAKARQRAEAQEAYRAAQAKYETARKAGEEKKSSDKKIEHEAQEPSGKAKAAKSRWDLSKIKTGGAFTIVGLSLMGVFGFATIMTLVESLSLIGAQPVVLLEQILPLFICTGVGAGLFTWGRFKKSQSKRFKRYLSLIGDQDQVSISALAAAYPAKRDAACTTLENMIEAGVFGDRAYLDYGRDLLVLDGSGVQPEAKAAPETPTGEQHILLRQIRRINDAIADPEMSRKIDRIEEITQRILEFQQEHPEKSAELRKFLNYYLPTTLKILTSYAELERQGVEGTNIAATKQRIEGMMDMVVEGFEQQLDKLFAGDMMDIAADITVMEQMMEGDGLFQKGGPGMGSGSGSGGDIGMGGR